MRTNSNKSWFVGIQEYQACTWEDPIPPLNNCLTTHIRYNARDTDTVYMYKLAVAQRVPVNY